MKVINKTVSMNRNTYTLRVIEGTMFFSVRISTTGANRNLYTPKIQAAIMAAIIEADHAEALELNAEIVASAAVMKDKALNAYWLDCESMKVVVAYNEWLAMHAEALAMNAEYDAESARIDRLCPGTTEEKNQFKAIAAKYILGVALLFTGAVAHAETLPQYPNQAVRLSMQGSTSVSINCDTKRVKVNSESTSAAYFSRQVKKDVYSICYGESGILNRKYIFEMDRNNGRHNMLATDPGRWSLTIKAVKED